MGIPFDAVPDGSGPLLFVLQVIGTVTTVAVLEKVMVKAWLGTMLSGIDVAWVEVNV